MANGITIVCKPEGRGRDGTMSLKKQSEKNEIVTPRIYGHAILGRGWDTPVSTKEPARELVKENTENGADGVQFSGASPEVATAARDENKKLGLRSTCLHAQLS